MSVIIALAALALLMLAAYRGYSVILFAPFAALGAVLLTDPDASLAAIGRAAETLLGAGTGAQFVPFGLAKIYAYLSAVQREAKNLRIIFALRAAHADRETILQNIRV